VAELRKGPAVMAERRKPVLTMPSASYWPRGPPVGTATRLLHQPGGRMLHPRRRA